MKQGDSGLRGMRWGMERIGRAMFEPDRCAPFVGTPYLPVSPHFHVRLREAKINA